MKRFWKEATLRAVEGGWQVWLDERAVKTRGGAPQVVPTRALGELLRAEWAAAGEEFAPEDLPLRDLANSDVVFLGSRKIMERRSERAVGNHAEVDLQP